MITLIIENIKHWFVQSTYSSDLERYILSKNPQDSCDVEHFEKEFNQKLSQGKIL